MSTPPKKKKMEKQKREKDTRENSDKKDMPPQRTAGEATGAKLKREVGTVVKREEGDQELDSEGTVEHMAADPRT